jgi:hypothetical protein
MEASIDRFDPGLGILSQAHARGLRRDLFRMVGDRTRASLPVFRTRCALLQRPYRSSREMSAVFDRARQSLRSLVYDFRAAPDHCTGLVLIPVERRHEEGEAEALLEIAVATIDRRGGCMSGRLRPIGSIGQHAVERMFQRMKTTSKDEVMRDITGFALWIELIHIVSIASVDRDRIEQLPLPTPHGIFLCDRETDEWQVHLRTWLPHGASARCDASVASIVHWVHGFRSTSAFDAVKSFEAMASLPENHWWRTPHRRDA